ncbi:MAG: LysM peptidoglycan-binding domain-containing protein [Nocardioidaceae bacterium]
MRSIEQVFDPAAVGGRALSVGADTTRHHGITPDTRHRSRIQRGGTRRFQMSSLAVATAIRSPRTDVGRLDRAPERVARANCFTTGLRLTRRGRLVVLVTFLAAVLAVGVFALSGAATGSGERGEPIPVTMVQVESGDTLWSIATRVAPGEDPRDLIDEIEELNSLNGSLPVGERIAVPVAE